MSKLYADQLDAEIDDFQNERPTLGNLSRFVRRLRDLANLMRELDDPLASRAVQAGSIPVPRPAPPLHAEDDLGDVNPFVTTDRMAARMRDEGMW